MYHAHIQDNGVTTNSSESMSSNKLVIAEEHLFQVCLTHSSGASEPFGHAEIFDGPLQNGTPLSRERESFLQNGLSTRKACSGI